MISERFFKDEVAISGTSAGTAVQDGISEFFGVDPMIGGGESYEAMTFKARETPCPSWDHSCENDLFYIRSGGFSFFKLGLLDTHFS